MEPNSDPMGIDEYYNLTIKNQSAIDQWLKECGGNPIVTRKITISEGEVITEEYVLRNGELNYDWDIKDVEHSQKVYELSSPPPVWINDLPYSE